MQDRNNCSLRTVLVMRSQSTRLLGVRNMCSLHISTDSWVLSHAFGMERDYYAVPFKPRFISQSLCKCDRSLPLESIRKNPRILNASFSFCNRSQGYFLLFLELRDKRKVSQRNLYGLLEIRVLRNLFPKCKSMIRAQFCLQHRESVNMKTFDQSEHDIRFWLL